MNRAIEYMLENKPDKDLVKHYFFINFGFVRMLGPLEAMTLVEWEDGFSDYESVVAYFFLGAVWGLTSFEGSKINTPKVGFDSFNVAEAWGWVLEMVKDW
jgi:hypothetical protein